MQCELSVECALEARLTHLFFPSPSHNSLFTQVIKIELKDTNGNAYASTSSPSFPSFSGSASSAESYQSQRHNVKYFAGYARFNQSKQSAQELLMCVCAQVYTNIICKSRGPEPREREGDQIRLVSSSCCHVVGMEMKLELGRPCRVPLEMVGMIQIILLC